MHFFSDPLRNGDPVFLLHFFSKLLPSDEAISALGDQTLSCFCFFIFFLLSSLHRVLAFRQFLCCSCPPIAVRFPFFLFALKIPTFLVFFFFLCLSPSPALFYYRFFSMTAFYSRLLAVFLKCLKTRGSAFYLVIPVIILSDPPPPFFF